MKRKNLLFSMLFVLLQVAVFAQGKVIKGTITDSKTKETLPGVTILVEGTTVATSTNMNGEFTINVEGEGKKLVISSIGYVTKTVDANQDVITISLDSDAKLLTETVVTALGVSREKKTLGYATQELNGAELNAVKSGNFVNQMSGKLAGVQIKNSGNMGGSTNIIIRGTTSIFGNNQALFIVDGVPINNSVTNGDVTGGNRITGGGQSSGQSGYDYGSPISDINPEDIESMNVLKGAAATALYGSRAANGVVLITTKKGRLAAGTGRTRYGVTINSGVLVGIVDKSTFPTYQTKYGAGAGPHYDLSDPNDPNSNTYWLFRDLNGETNAMVVPMLEDASYGAKFDPSLNVYQWDAFTPGMANFNKKSPWVNKVDQGPIKFFKPSVSYTNSVTVEGGTDKGSFRVSYSNNDTKGIMPNSSLKKNSVSVNGGIQMNNKFSVNASANYVKNNAIGRNETGYNGNIMTSYRQWWETNVSVVDQKKAYEVAETNATWNLNDPDNATPAYWDNFYFTRYKSFNSDVRDRFYGNTALTYKINDAVNVVGRVSIDQYTTLQEERVATGSVAKAFGTSRGNVGSGYSRYNKNYRELNYDLMVNLKKDLNEQFSLGGLVGTNIRRSYENTIFASTNGGLITPGLYALSNSKTAPTPDLENQALIGVNGFFANASLGFKRFIYLDVTARQDYSSTLPSEVKNHFFYPGVSGSVIFSEKLKQLTWLDFGKVRLNYAQVGNDAPFGSTKDIYASIPVFNSAALYSLPNAKNNSTLRPEISTTAEAGLEMTFLKKRVGFDFAVYNKITKDQIMPVAVSAATGYTSKFVNAGKIQNRGIELSLFVSPIQTKDFKWTISCNYAKNTSKVLELFEGVDNVQIAAYSQGVTLNATKGESFGTLKGTDFVYIDGKKVVDQNGYYIKTATSTNIIGNVTPDFNAGINNILTYKNLSFNFLIDVQKGGDIFSLDMAYGLYAGIYPETAGLNSNGKEVRAPVSEGGGIVFDGVKADGSKNDIFADATEGAFGSNHNPNAAFVYDASYVKLREVGLNYRVPFKKELFFSSVTVGLVANNVWILFKNLPYADPESTLSAGNAQGFQVGVQPTTRNFGFNLTLQF
jgi:TonB-linked SusC/RagA family outer membrane protein